MSLKIPFDEIVLEDAISLLNYASPYKLELTVSKVGCSNVARLNNRNSSKPTNSAGNGSIKFELCYKTDHAHACSLQHPIYRSLSVPNFGGSFKAATNRSERLPDTSSTSPIDSREAALKQIEESMRFSSNGGIWQKLKNQFNHVRRETIHPIEQWLSHRKSPNRFDDQVMATKKHMELDAIVIGNSVFGHSHLPASVHSSDHVGSLDMVSSRRNTERNSTLGSNHALNSFAYHNEAMEYSPEISHKSFGSRLFSTSVDNRPNAFPSQPKRADFFVHSSIDERLATMADHSQWTLNAMPTRFNSNAVDLHTDYLNHSASQSCRKVSI